MSLDITRGGLLVGIAIFGVIAYELRTVAEILGVEVPLIPYLALVFAAAGVAVWFVSLKGGWRTDTDEAA
ncbi:CbaC protein [Halorubrum sp. DTA98]|uniref:CbaC protein n=1 Tax=Halorubrum sp. DTA98 TaxID=3402163 RepID=UPI003AAC9CBD